MEKIDAAESRVKGMRSADVDETKKAITNYKAVRSFGLGRVDFADSLPVQHVDDRRAAGAVRPACAVLPVTPNRRFGCVWAAVVCDFVGFISKHAASCPNVREPTFPFNKVPQLPSQRWKMKHFQIDELAACAARRGRMTREVRPADVDEEEQNVLTKYKAIWAFADAKFPLGKPILSVPDVAPAGPVQQADDVSAIGAVPGLHIHQSDLNIRHESTCPEG